MFPLRDTIRSRQFPLITWILIGINGLVFILELSFSPAQLDQFIYNYGLVPARFSYTNPLTWLPLLSHMFMHAGWLHFISNMWTLFIFGDNVEDRMGSFRFLVFYILGGFAAGLLQTFVSAGADIPSIGASGAIAAVLGAYFLFYPKARVVTFIPLFFLPWIMEIPAIVYLGFWFVSQLFSGALSLASASGTISGGVAWWAHIGGFVFGLAICMLFTIGRPKTSWHRDEYYPW